MSLSKTEKKEVNIVKAAMLEADRIAKERREEAKFNEAHGIKTSEDSERFVQQCKDEVLAKTSQFGKVATGEKAVPPVDKKKCLNCGGRVLRQHDETKSTVKEIVWTGYDCLACGEKGMQL